MRAGYFFSRALFIVLLIAAGAAAAEPATQPSPELKLKVERLVVFKDGHGLVIKSGGGTTDAEGRAFISEVPDAAVLGCFWASNDDKIVAMRAQWHEETQTREQQTEAVTVAELLRANVGKPMTLELTDRDSAGMPVVVKGELVELLDVPPDKDQPWTRRPNSSARPALMLAGPRIYSSFIQNGVAQNGAFTPESFAGEGTLVRDLVPRGGDFAVIAQENEQRIILPVNRVQAIRGGTNLITTTTHRQEVFTRSKRIGFDFGEDAAGKNVSLRLFYFTAGLRWIPTYRVSGDLKERADLTLQGEILNDVTDVQDAALDLVVGVPHFRFDDTVSPLTLEQAMRMTAAAANLANNNAYQSQVSFDNGGRAAAARALDAGMSAAPELGGASEQDLFVYNITKFSLQKGARAAVPLWQQPADLRHVYTCDLKTRRSRASGGLIEQEQVAESSDGNSGARRGRSPNSIVMNQVWHQLELRNGSKVPWTTGAALMLRNMLPLGQDLLVYTPPGGKALLPVTVAVDIRGTIDEQELSRKQSALHFNGDEYMQITKKGTITLSSYRKEQSQMCISLATAGETANLSDNGKMKLNDGRAADWDDNNNVRVNNHSDVTWELTLEPGETKTITYDVSFFTR
jgi:hypothetical protein